MHIRKIGDETPPQDEAQALKRPVVLIDVRLIGEAGGGFTTYQTQLAQAIHRVRERLLWRPVFLVREAGILRLDRLGLKGLEFLETDINFLAPDELWTLPQLMKKVQARLWVSTTFSSLPTWLMPCPWLIAIHDLNHLKWGGLAQKIYYRRLLRPFARKAARVLTVSDFSRRELSGWLKIPREEIRLACNALDSVLSHPMTEGELDSGLAKFGLERDQFFLLLTNSKPHKNAAVLIQAWREWADWQKERGVDPMPLVVSFPAPVDGGVKGVKYVGGLGAREARQMVRSARTLFFPSLYEGFGLPPVEAIAQGTPVCVSSIAPHREGLAEVDPKCIRWVTEPGSQAAWVAAIEDISKAPLLRPSVQEQGRIQNRFSPEKMAESWILEIDQALGFGDRRGQP